MKTREMQEEVDQLVGKKIVATRIKHSSPYNDEAMELELILDDGTKVEIGASWDDNGEFHLYGYPASYLNKFRIER